MAEQLLLQNINPVSKLMRLLTKLSLADISEIGIYSSETGFICTEARESLPGLNAFQPLLAML